MSEDKEKHIIKELYEVILDRRENPVTGSYTNYLFNKGTTKICKKVGEEAIEVVMASLSESREKTVAEMADLQYHLMVLMADQGITPDDVYEELKKRR